MLQVELAGESAVDSQHKLILSAVGCQHKIILSAVDSQHELFTKR